MFDSKLLPEVVQGRRVDFLSKDTLTERLWNMRRLDNDEAKLKKSVGGGGGQKLLLQTKKTLIWRNTAAMQKHESWGERAQSTWDREHTRRERERERERGERESNHHFGEKLLCKLLGLPHTWSVHRLLTRGARLEQMSCCPCDDVGKRDLMIDEEDSATFQSATTR